MSAVEATLLFQHAASQFDRALRALTESRCTEGLRDAREALKFFIRSLSILMGQPLHGIENPHLLAAVAEPFIGNAVFRTVTEAYLAENVERDHCKALRLYVEACREVTEKIGNVDKYLDISKRMYRY